MGKNRQPRQGTACSENGICKRLVEIRRLRYGERGKSALARDLGIPVTTYVHYEAGRLPPADLLVRLARVTGVRLEWLMTGDGPREGRMNSPASPPLRELAEQLLRILDRTPQLTSSVQQYFQFLESVSSAEPNTLPLATMGATHAKFIPLVGSTAAGPARFWRELARTQEGPDVDRQLEIRLAAHFERTVREVSASGGAGPLAGERAALVQYSRPDASGFLEFLSADDLKRRYPLAVAWRIDGESMSPRYLDGDLVITSPDHPAVELQPCVARQSGQIGVNCKLYQVSGNDVLLIPVNEAHAVQRVPRENIQWAWRVLSSVRLG